MDLVFSWLLLSAAVLIAAKLLPGIHVADFGDAVIVALLFGVANALLGWLLFVMIGIATLGLGFALAFVSRLIVSALLLQLVDALTARLSVRSFGHAALAALFISGLGTLAEWTLGISY